MSHLGVMVVHGFAGTPHSVMPITTAVHAAGYATVAPQLPGHGTTVDDLARRTWGDWLGDLGEVADDLSRRCDGIAIIGQSMGGTLALQLATMRADVRGIATINAVTQPADPDVIEHLEDMIERGKMLQPAGDPDIRDPHSHDSAYAELPRTALLQMTVGAGAVFDVLADVTVPVMVVTSDHDAVVDPANSHAIASRVSGPVTRLRLANSAHIAALDMDRDLLCDELLSWLGGLSATQCSTAALLTE